MPSPVMLRIMELMKKTPAVVTYATWNPSDKSADITLSGGNLTATGTTAAGKSVRSTLSKTSGKWYWEFTATSAAVAIGVATSSASLASFTGGDINGWGYSSNGLLYNNSSGTGSNASYTSGDIIGVAWDVAAGTISFYKNNTLQPSGFSSIPSGCFVACGNTSASGLGTANFGATALTYSPPSGFNAGLYT